MKQLHKFYSHADIPWVNLVWQAHYHNDAAPQSCNSKGSFWWRDCMKLFDIYSKLTTCIARKGDTILLWKDRWSGQPLMDKFPELHSFTNDDNIPMHKDKTPDNYYSMFQLPLSNVAHQQFIQLSNSLDQIRNNQDIDIWKFIWGDYGYNTKKVYKALMSPSYTTPPPITWIWKTCCLPRHKFFCWLMLHDRVNTCDLLTRKKMQLDSTHCSLC